MVTSDSLFSSRSVAVLDLEYCQFWSSVFVGSVLVVWSILSFVASVLLVGSDCDGSSATLVDTVTVLGASSAKIVVASLLNKNTKPNKNPIMNKGK